MTGPATDFLARIAEARRRRIEEMSARVPAHALRAQLGTAPPAGRLERALRRGRAGDGTAGGPLRLVCEFKRASPSRGVLNAGADPVAYARIYQAGGAAAISLVTEPDQFHGDLAWVAQVKAAVSLPILMKDFVLDSYQLLDAAVRGADGVLLLASLLSDVQLQRLISEARLLGLDALVEVHDEVELDVALEAGAEVLGINNRDLKTFEISLDVTERLAPRVPAETLLVSESGISSREDARRVRRAGASAILVGSAIVSAPDPAAKVQELVS